MTDKQKVIVTLKARLDAIAEPEVGSWLQAARNAKQDALWLRYREGHGIATNVSGDTAEQRQRRNRTLDCLFSDGLLEAVSDGERVTRANFTEAGMQYAEHLVQQASIDLNIMTVEDAFSLTDETPCGVDFMGRRWLPLWALAGVPEWGFCSEAKDARTKTVINNTFSDLTAVIARGGMDSAMSDEPYFALTDEGRQLATSDAEMPVYEFAPLDHETQREIMIAYHAEREAEQRRLADMDTREVNIGLPVGAWSREGLEWVFSDYWRWRNQQFRPECSECGATWEKPRSKLTCSPACRRARAARLKKLNHKD